MIPVASFSYNGGKFSVVNEDSICFPSGSFICVWNTANGRKDFIVPPNYGFSAVTANYTKGYIAACEHKLRPDVYIYRYTSTNAGGRTEVVDKFPAETTIQCVDMHLTRDCSRLLMVGSKPDFKLSVYDLNEKRMLTVDKKLRDRAHIKAEFDPANDEVFAVMGQHQLMLYRIHRAYQVREEGGQDVIDESERVSECDYELDPGNRFFTFVWDQYSKIFASTAAATVVMIDGNTGREESVFQLEHPARSIVLT